MAIATKKPTHRTQAQVVWTLVRVIHGEREIVGQFSTEAKGVQETHRIIGRECGMKVFKHLPPWTSQMHGRVFVHGRDKHSWYFRLEPWPLDGESA